MVLPMPLFEPTPRNSVQHYVLVPHRHASCRQNRYFLAVLVQPPFQPKANMPAQYRQFGRQFCRPLQYRRLRRSLSPRNPLSPPTFPGPNHSNPGKKLGPSLIRRQEGTVFRANSVGFLSRNASAAHLAVEPQNSELNEVPPIAPATQMVFRATAARGFSYQRGLSAAAECVPPHILVPHTPQNTRVDRFSFGIFRTQWRKCRACFAPIPKQCF